MKGFLVLKLNVSLQGFVSILASTWLSWRAVFRYCLDGMSVRTKRGGMLHFKAPWLQVKAIWSARRIDCVPSRRGNQVSIAAGGGIISELCKNGLTFESAYWPWDRLVIDGFLPSAKVKQRRAWERIPSMARYWGKWKTRLPHQGADTGELGRRQQNHISDYRTLITVCLG